MPLGGHRDGPEGGPSPQGCGRQGRQHLRNPHPRRAGLAHPQDAPKPGQHRQRKGRPSDHGPRNHPRAPRPLVQTGRAPLPPEAEQHQAQDHGGLRKGLVHLLGRKLLRLEALRTSALRLQPLPPAQPPRNLLRGASGTHHRVPRIRGHPPRGQDQSLCLAISAQALAAGAASPRRPETDNPKYTFRCWLLRLGFIGDEFATAREHLLKNLPGNAAWRQAS